jgi:hypothetical protein
MAVDLTSDVESWILEQSTLDAAHTYLLVYEPLILFELFQVGM